VVTDDSPPGPLDAEIEGAAQPLARAGADGRLCAVNAAARALLGAPAERLVGSAVGDVAGGHGVLTVLVDREQAGETERLLERRVAQQAAVAVLGERALKGTRTAALKDAAVEAIAQNLELDQAGYLEHQAHAGRLVMRAGIGWPEGWLGQWALDEGGEVPAAVALRTGEPIFVCDWATEERFERPPVGEDFELGSTMLVPVRNREQAAGCLVAHARRANAFTSDDLHFVQSLANVLSDAIERERVELAVRHQALHDRVTGLPNRSLLLDRLGHALALGGRRRREVAVLFLDLDHFKVINDTLGHAAGDELLAQVAPRLREAVRPADTVARFGGDEFVLLCENVGGAEATAIARRVLRSFAAPLEVAGHEHFVNASGGLALSRPRGDTAESLLRDADAAMYLAKERGRGRYEIFDEDLRRRALARLQMEADLRRALTAGELELHYQPIVDLAGGGVRAAEALVRWRDPDRGLLTPQDFLAVAEEAGLIAPLTEWVLKAALEQAAAWRAGHPALAELVVAVNVSSADVARVDFVDAVADALTTTGLPPDALSLEISEAALQDPGESGVGTLRLLRHLGVRITLDDFGTGSSSLSHLERFPVSALKIDRSFVARLQGGIAQAPVARAILGLADALDLEVVAEGVETPEEEQGLLELGCRLAQGFRYAAPARAVDCGAWLGGAAVVIGP
jgi:diguanylate cyclase (GGDEF)-like protein